MTSQAVVIGAVLYYFGWARTKIIFEHYGVDTSLLGYTTTDYLLRSVNSAVPPLIGAVLVSLVLYGIHQRFVAPGSRVRRLLERSRVLLIGLGGVLLVVALVGLLWSKAAAILGAALPLAVVVAVVLIAYGQYLRPRAADETSMTVPVTVLLATLGLLGSAWALALYAQQLGREAALTSHARLRGEPEIVLYSTERLAIAGPGVRIDPLTMDASRYRFRYTGLRLLTRTAGKYILLPAEWQPGLDSVFLVPDNDSIRADVLVTVPAGPVDDGSH